MSGKNVGDPTNITWSRQLKKNIGLVLIDAKCKIGDRVAVTQHHDSAVGTVTELPFLQGQLIGRRSQQLRQSAVPRGNHCQKSAAIKLNHQFSYFPYPQYAGSARVLCRSFYRRGGKHTARRPPAAGGLCQ